jgi:hypothetical protein
VSDEGSKALNRFLELAIDCRNIASIEETTLSAVFVSSSLRLASLDSLRTPQSPEQLAKCRDCRMSYHSNFSDKLSFENPAQLPLQIPLCSSPNFQQSPPPHSLHYSPIPSSHFFYLSSTPSHFIPRKKLSSPRRVAKVPSQIFAPKKRSRREIRIAPY